MTESSQENHTVKASSPVPIRVLLSLVIGVVALSQSGNLIRISDAHPVAIAAWRLLFAGLLFLPFAGRRLSQVSRLSPANKGWLVLAAAALAFHFFTWIAAVQNTTVANAAIVIAINPVFTALLSHFVFGEVITRRLVTAILLGIVGVAIVGWGDLSFAEANLKGDGLAILASLIFTLYLLIGKRLRGSLDTPVYVSAMYLIAAGFGFAAMVVLQIPVGAYGRRDWLCFFLMALIPTMIGHTSLNNALRHMGAGRVSVVVLAEPLLAGLVAYLAWDEVMTPLSLLGYAAIAASVVALSLDLTAAR